MTTEIHAFIEYHGGESEPFSEEGDVRSFNLGEFLVACDYALFDLLAGARSRTNNKGSSEVMFSPRGLPDNCSDSVFRRFSVVIDDQANRSKLEIPVPVIAEPRRKSFVENAILVSSTDGERLFQNPNWHSISWLTFEELKLICEKHGRLNAEFSAIVAAMSCLETELGTGRTRLVFWFDN